MNEEEVNTVVMNYLKQKGYTHTQQRFAEEASVLSLGALAQRVKQDEAASVTNYILYHNAAQESLPSDYEKSYALYKEWAQASLNSNRAELLSVLYPVFAHSYIDLVAKGFAQEGKQLLQ